MREFFWKHDTGVKITLLAIALLLVANAFGQSREKIVEKIFQAAPQSAVYECDEECHRVIDERIAQLAATLSATPKTLGSPSPVVKESAADTFYIGLGTGVSTTETDWARVSGSEVAFDIADYPADAKVYWEGNLKTESKDSRCYARLYDKTNFRAVDFSEQSTNTTQYEYLRSQPLTIWFGKIKYQLEIKSLNGLNCTLDSPKMLIKS